MNKSAGQPSQRPRRRMPRTFKDLTPTKAFNPRTFFREMVWKALLTPRIGQHKRPEFPKLTPGQVALTWMLHDAAGNQTRDNMLAKRPIRNYGEWYQRASLTAVRIVDSEVLQRTKGNQRFRPTPVARYMREAGWLCQAI